MPGPPRPRQPSKPDPRVEEEDTPVEGTVIEPAAIVPRPIGQDVLTVAAINILRDEMRDIRARLGAVEDQNETHDEEIQKLQDWTESTKVRDLKVKKRWSWWLERLAKVGEGVAVALVLLALAYALSRVACVSPQPLPELKPKIDRIEPPTSGSKP